MNYLLCRCCPTTDGTVLGHSTHECALSVCLRFVIELHSINILECINTYIWKGLCDVIELAYTCLNGACSNACYWQCHG